MLAENCTTLATADAVGLSVWPPARPALKCAMSLGDMPKAARAYIFCGLSPFGPSIVMGTDSEFCGLGFADEIGR
jgi:hypothetical protein